MAELTVGSGVIEIRADGSRVAGDVAATENSARGSAKSAGDGLGKTIVGALGGAFAGFKLGEVISGAVDQNAIQTNLGAKLSGVGKTVSAQAGKDAGQVYAAGYGESLGDVNDAFFAIQNNLGGLSNFSSQESQKMASDALTIADVYGVDVNDVIKTTGQLMKNGLAPDAQSAMDIVSAGFQNGLDNSGELLDSLNEYAEPLSAIGLNGADALGAFKRSLDAGNFSIDKAGDAINEFATRSIDGSATTRDAYKALGLNADEMMQKISGGGEQAKQATQEVIARLGSMKDNVAQDAAGVGLFGSMWEDAGKKTILALDPALGSMDNVSGATERLGDANNSAATKIESMRRGFEQWRNGLVQVDGPIGQVTAGLGVMGPEGIAAGAGVIMATKSLGSMTMAIGRSTVALATSTGAKIADKAETVALAAMYGKDMVVSMGQTAAAAVRTGAAQVAATARASAATVSGLAVQTAAAAKNGAIWAANTTKVAAAAVVQTAMKAPMLASAVATGVATAAQWAFSAALWASPITWIVLGIIALIAVIVLLATHWQEVVSFVTTVWNGFISWITGVINALAAWWSGVWASISAAARAVWSAIVGFVTAYINAVRTVIMAIVGAIVGWWQATWSGISAVARAVWSGIVAFVTAYINTVRSIITAVVNGIRGTWQAGWNAVRGAVQSAVSAVISIAQGMAGSVRSAIANVVGFFSGIQSSVMGALSGAGSWLVSTGRNIIEGLLGGLRAMAGRIKDAVVGPIQDAIAGAKSLLGIHSPSRLFDWMGRMTGQGLVRGLRYMMPTVNSAAMGLVKPVSDIGLGGGDRPDAGGPGLGGGTPAAPSGGDTYHVQVDQHFTTDDPTAAGRQSARAIIDRLK